MNPSEFFHNQLCSVNRTIFDETLGYCCPTPIEYDAVANGYLDSFPLARLM